MEIKKLEIWNSRKLQIIYKNEENIDWFSTLILFFSSNICVLTSDKLILNLFLNSFLFSSMGLLVLVLGLVVFKLLLLFVFSNSLFSLFFISLFLLLSVYLLVLI